MESAPTTSAEDPTPGRRAAAAAEVVLIAMLFLLQAGWHVPDVNEPHYLAKANHYWDTQWCDSDFFLASRDAHRVFYWAFGWLTLYFPLAQVAWIGRLVTWSMLAWAWRGLSWSLIARPGYALLSAAVWLALLANCHLSGEWVIGGVEAKGFAYILVLLGLKALVQGQWKRVWPLFGAAAAFHVLVGGWSIVAAGIAWCFSRRDAPGLREMLPALILGFVLSLSGLLPGLLLNRGVPAEITQEANQIYVFSRLKHHLAMHTLEPAEIVPRAAVNGALLIGFFAVLRFVPWSPSYRRLRGFVVGTMLIAFAGLVISLVLANQPAVAAGLLRYYWFRLYDFALPLGAALLLCAVLVRLLASYRWAGQLGITFAMLGVLWHFVPTVAANARAAFAPANKHTQPEQDWIEACLWIRGHTPPDALFLTPRMSSTFKWYAERPEVVTQKDTPQDALGIVEWWDRMDRVHRFRHVDEDGTVERRYRKSLALQGEPMLTRLGHKYGAAFLITRTSRPLAFEQLYKNDSFAVYRIPGVDIETPQP